MLANRFRVTEVVKLLNQTVEKPFFRGSADLPEFNGREVFDLISDRVLVDLYGCQGFLVAE